MNTHSYSHSMIRILFAASGLFCAEASIAVISLPRQGGTTPEQTSYTRDCPGDDEYLSGIHGDTSWDALQLTANSIANARGGAVNGVRRVAISCRRMLDEGAVTAPHDVGDAVGYPGEALFNVSPPTYRRECGRHDGNGNLVEVGLVSGFYGWIRSGEKGFIRTLGLSCMLLDGERIPASVQTPLPAAEAGTSPDFSINCPNGQAAVGLTLGISQLKAPFDPREMMSVQLRCRPYFNAPGNVATLSPDPGEVIDQFSGALFKWSATPRARGYEVCATVLGPRTCRRSASTSLPVDDLVGSSAVGREFSWSVRGCALDPKPGFDTLRLCGPRTLVPTSSAALAVRFAPRRPVVTTAPGRRTYSTSLPILIDLGLQGQPLTDRYRIQVEGATSFQEQVVDENSSTGSSHQLRLSIPGPPPMLPGGNKPTPLLLRAAVRGCAFDSTTKREVCGTPARGSGILADLSGRVCVATKQVVADQKCPPTLGL